MLSNQWSNWCSSRSFRVIGWKIALRISSSSDVERASFVILSWYLSSPATGQFALSEWMALDLPCRFMLDGAECWGMSVKTKPSFKAHNLMVVKMSNAEELIANWTIDARTVVLTVKQLTKQSCDVEYAASTNTLQQIFNTWIFNWHCLHYTEPSLRCGIQWKSKWPNAML